MHRRLREEIEETATPCELCASEIKQCGTGTPRPATVCDWHYQRGLGADAPGGKVDRIALFDWFSTQDYRKLDTLQLTELFADLIDSGKLPRKGVDDDR